jgi:DeoR/GlpR family transcriptional regulator of sugar metabolism
VLLPSDLALTVITNSVPVAATLMGRPGIALVLIGGSVNATVGGCVDARAITELRRFRFDLCFLGACAMSVENGVAGFDMGDVDFKRSLLDVSTTAALLLTNTKIGTSAPFHIAPATDIDHPVLEHDAPVDFLFALRRMGAEIRVADAPDATDHPTRSQALP